WAAADDLCAPEFLEKCVAILDEHPEVVLCYPKTTIIDEHGKVIRQYEDGLDLRYPKACDRFRWAINHIVECNAVFGVVRSNILRKTSLIQNYFSSDTILLTELTLYGQFYEVPERLFFRRHHPKASSSNTSIESQQEFFDPKTKGKISLYRWKHHVQYLDNIRRAPLKPWEKIWLVSLVLYYGIRAWHSLVKELLGAFSHIVRKISPAEFS